MIPKELTKDWEIHEAWDTTEVIELLLAHQAADDEALATLDVCTRRDITRRDLRSATRAALVRDVARDIADFCGKLQADVARIFIDDWRHRETRADILIRDRDIGGRCRVGRREDRDTVAEEDFGFLPILGKCHRARDDAAFIEFTACRSGCAERQFLWPRAFEVIVSSMTVERKLIAHAEVETLAVADFDELGNKQALWDPVTVIVPVSSLA